LEEFPLLESGCPFIENHMSGGVIINNIYTKYTKWAKYTKHNKYSMFKVFMFAYWAMMLSISGMYAMYIAQIGFSKKEISIAVTIFTFAALIGQNVFGYLADRFKCIKKILLVAISVGIIASIALNFSKQSWFISILIFLWGFFLYGTVPLSEAWYIGILKANGDQREFGKIRGIGSIGYGISGIILGLLLQNIGWNLYSWYILISSCAVLLVITLMSESKEIALYKAGGGDGCGDTNNASFKEAFEQIITIKSLRTIIIIVFIYSFVLKGIYSYLGVLVSDFGGGPLSLGLAYFFDASPEIITFILTSKLLSKYKSKDLILIAFILQIIRLSLILVFNSPLSIILLGALSGFAYGLIATAYKTYIYEVAPEKYKISCLSLSESIIGLSGVISAPVYGYLIIKFGGYTSIAIGLSIYIAMTLIISGKLYIERKKEREKEKQKESQYEIRI